MAIADVSAKPIAELISLKGRVAVVTGGAQGLGRGIVNRLAEAGAAVLILDLKADQAEAAAQQVSETTGSRVIAAAVDVMRAAGIHAKVAESTVETAVIGALRSYLRAGRRGWTGPVARADRDELRRQYHALFDINANLAEMFLKIAVDYLAESAAKPRKKAN